MRKPHTMVCHVSREYVPLRSESLVLWWCCGTFGVIAPPPPPYLSSCSHLPSPSSYSPLSFSVQPSSGCLCFQSSNGYVDLEGAEIHLLGKNTYYQPFCDLMVPFFAANELHDLGHEALKGRNLKLFALSEVGGIMKNSHLCSIKG